MRSAASCKTRSVQPQPADSCFAALASKEPAASWPVVPRHIPALDRRTPQFRRRGRPPFRPSTGPTAGRRPEPRIDRRHARSQAAPACTANRSNPRVSRPTTANTARMIWDRSNRPTLSNYPRRTPFLATVALRSRVAKHAPRDRSQPGTRSTILPCNTPLLLSVLDSCKRCASAA